MIWFGMKPLRAFLFSISPSGEWSSTAFRELEPLLDATHKALALESASAAIHIGFWRPETIKVSELAQLWKGALLISEAAVGAFPPPLTVSRTSVGQVEGVAFRVALNGFGYQIEDPSPILSEKHSMLHQKIEVDKFTPRGWVAKLIAEKPEYEKILHNVHIWDDASYQENEPNLGSDERLAIALLRFRLITGTTVSQKNILDNLHACPHWFLDDELKFLELNLRMRNVCNANSLITVGNFATKGLSGLLKLPNLGHGSVYDMGTLLWKAFINGDALQRKNWSDPDFISDDLRHAPIPAKAALEGSDSFGSLTNRKSENITSGFVDAAQVLTEQERGIWAARIGFRCKSQTLQLIADDIGVTRERVRQIEAKIYRRVGSHIFWKQLAVRISTHLDDRTSSLMLNGISAVDPWFKGAEDLKEPLRQVFNHILKNEFSILDINESPVITRLTLSEWEKAITLGKTLLREMADKKVSEDYAQVQIESILVGAGKELRNDLWSIVKTIPLWATNPDGHRIIVGYGRTAEDVVAAVLVNAGHPLHFSEIYQRAKLISGKEHEERALHNAAHNVAVLYSRGTYGFLSHCPLSPNELALIEVEIEDIAEDNPIHKQWHSADLLDELLERGLDFDGKLTKYIINIALRNSNSFSYMRRMVWGYKSSWKPSASSRLDIRQAVTALLEDAGQPLTISEIRERLQDDRGLGNHFQIHPEGNLISLGLGLWGLANRDIEASDPDALVDQLVSHLQASQEGMHSSEVSKLLGDISESDANAIICLAKHKGIRRDNSQYVYPSSWEGSRRIGPGLAVLDVLDAHPQGVSIEKIRMEVNRLTKRDINPAFISHLLAQSDYASYDSEAELWRGSDDPEDDMDEDEKEGSKEA